MVKPQEIFPGKTAGKPTGNSKSAGNFAGNSEIHI